MDEAMKVVEMGRKKEDEAVDKSRVELSGRQQEARDSQGTSQSSTTHDVPVSVEPPSKSGESLIVP
jgi:hypothetical protein